MPTWFSTPEIEKVVVRFGQGDLDRCAKFLIDTRSRINATVAEAEFNDCTITATADSTVESIMQDYRAQRDKKAAVPAS